MNDQIGLAELPCSQDEGRHLLHSLGRLAADGHTRSACRRGDDGALVFVSYEGRSHLDTGNAYTTPRFRTGDPRYAWMNRVQAVAKGRWDSDAMRVTYPMVYELR